MNCILPIDITIRHTYIGHTYIGNTYIGHTLAIGIPAIPRDLTFVMYKRHAYHSLKHKPRVVNYDYYDECT